MPDQWYYGRGAEIYGPFSGWDVAELADAGAVLATDTVWQDGDEDGVPAGAVPHLFPAAVVAVAPLPAAEPKPPRAPGPGGGRGRGDDRRPGWHHRPVPDEVHRVRAEDRNSNPRTIGRGTLRVPFFCPKCRKRRTAEIHCQLR